MQRKVSRLVHAYRAYTVYKAFGDGFMQAGSDFYCSLDPYDPEFLEKFQQQFPELMTDEWGYNADPDESTGKVGIYAASSGKLAIYLSPIM